MTCHCDTLRIWESNTSLFDGIPAVVAHKLPAARPSVVLGTLLQNVVGVSGLEQRPVAAALGFVGQLEKPGKNCFQLRHDQIVMRTYLDGDCGVCSGS